MEIIAYNTFGLTAIGQKLFQESIESYVYSILGSQAQTRWSIVGAGAKSSQTQDVFHKIAEDTITQSDQTVTISDMRKSIQDTNVVLNLAISPGIILAPSRMIILKKAIVGYNNVLTIATKGMRFGKNGGVNYKDPAKQPPPEVVKHPVRVPPKSPMKDIEDKSPQKHGGTEGSKTTEIPIVVKRKAKDSSEITSFLVSGVLAYIIPRIFF